MFKIMITSINEWRKINEEFPPLEQEKTLPEADTTVNNSIEQVGRLSDTLTAILNTQIKNELMSSQIYMGMTCWLDDKGLIGASKYFFKTAKEELNHMNKIYEYLFDRNVIALVPSTELVQQVFNDIRDVVNKSLEHEILVTSNWNDISNMAKNEGDNTTYEFAQWFLKEQIEEENKFRDILFKMDLHMPQWKIDELFEELIEA